MNDGALIGGGLVPAACFFAVAATVAMFPVLMYPGLPERRKAQRARALQPFLNYHSNDIFNWIYKET
jgi:hypothetical protein